MKLFNKLQQAFQTWRRFIQHLLGFENNQSWGKDINCWNSLLTSFFSTDFGHVLNGKTCFGGHQLLRITKLSFFVKFCTFYVAVYVFDQIVANYDILHKPRENS